MTTRRMLVGAVAMLLGSTTLAVAQADPGAVVAVPEPTEQAMRYYASGCVLWWVNTAGGILVPVLFLFTGLSARIRDRARAIGRKWFFVIGAYVVVYTLLNFVIDLPLNYYQGFVRQHAYELSNQTVGKWFGDAFKSLGVGLIVVCAVAWVPYLLLRKSPKRWWLYTGMAAVPFMIFIVLVSPLWIDPLFNEYGPMQDKALETKILALAERSGIEGGRVYEVNASVDTEAVNAYVTGFMGSKRIVLWDTTIDKLREDELLFIMAHEMGHYVLRHVATGIVLFSVVIVVMLYLVHRTAGVVMERFKGRFGFDELSDIASLPLIIALVNVLSLVITPVVLTHARHIEHEADRFGLEITRDNNAAARGFVALQAHNLGNPRPGLLYKIWRSSHPSLGDRIDFCNEYRPWATGEPSKYGDLFEK